MRKNPTPTERIIWEQVKTMKLGVKFRRQHIIDKYIVDFACVEKKLILEIDGKIHLHQKEADQERQKFLESQGFKFLRFTNKQVTTDLQKVLQTIKTNLS
jgi:very-short-patch-repair endonuclease